ncbi:MAG: hypothetical protein HS111_13830 [Kofleriaceae bacterium]|nr:hypothetical protein [Kofleriaceae bacterium]MCL4228697.1 hypothetical protein [Myxococcales bacterium]
MRRSTLALTFTFAVASVAGTASLGACTKPDRAVTPQAPTAVAPEPASPPSAATAPPPPGELPECTGPA